MHKKLNARRIAALRGTRNPHVPKSTIRFPVISNKRAVRLALQPSIQFLKVVK